MASDDLTNELHNQQPRQMTWNCQTDLSFDEVSKLFPVPIAEAATILGVGTTELQRICRENGVPRWPYRKILAGKTVEDIKKEAAKEKRLLEEMGQITTYHGSNPISGSKVGGLNLTTSSPMKTEKLRSDYMQQQSNRLVPVHAVQTSFLRPLHIERHAKLHRQFHLKVNTPTFLDDFRHGFPENGLSAFSTNWWGNATSEELKHQILDKFEEDVNALVPTKHLYLQHDDLSTAQPHVDCNKAKSKEQSRDVSEQSDLLPASVLTRTRKNAVINGRKGLRIAATRGYGTYQLGEKDKALLRTVFGDFLPSLWTASLFC